MVLTSYYTGEKAVYSSFEGGLATDGWRGKMAQRLRQVSITGAVACVEEHRRTGAFIHTQVCAVVVILRDRQTLLDQRLQEATKVRASRRRRCRR